MALALAVAITAGVSGLSCQTRPSTRLNLEPGSRPPIFLLTVDTVRADHYGMYGQPRDTTPNLDEFARDSVVFVNAFSGAPKTIPSIPQMLTGRYFPSLHSPHGDRTAAGDGSRSLVGLLNQAGYEATGAVLHNPHLDRWAKNSRPRFQEVDAAEYGAAEIIDRGLEFLDRHEDQTLALWLHFFDNHTPYSVPEPFASRFTGASDPDTIRAEIRDTEGNAVGPESAADAYLRVDQYDGTITYTDAEIGRFLDALVERGLYDDSLIILLSDHGDEFSDHGAYFHGHSLFDELIRVPLLVKFPKNSGAGLRHEGMVSVVDVVPTLAHLLSENPNAPSGSASGDGFSLIDAVRNRAARSDVAENDSIDPRFSDRAVFATVSRSERRSPPRHAVRTASHKYIENLEDGTSELYDLVNDPGEYNNIVKVDRRTADDLASTLAEFITPLMSSGLHIELRNPGKLATGYTLEVEGDVRQAFVNIHPLSLEAGDLLKEPKLRHNGVVVKGRLGPGDKDRIRMDLLGARKRLILNVELSSKINGPVDVRVGRDGQVIESLPATVAVADIEPGLPSAGDAGDDPSRRRVEVRLWNAGSNETEAAVPLVFSEEEKARLRAVGYLD